MWVVNNYFISIHYTYFLIINPFQVLTSNPPSPSIIQSGNDVDIVAGDVSDEVAEEEEEGEEEAGDEEAGDEEASEEEGEKEAGDEEASEEEGEEEASEEEGEEEAADVTEQVEEEEEEGEEEDIDNPDEEEEAGADDIDDGDPRVYDEDKDRSENEEEDEEEDEAEEAAEVSPDEILPSTSDEQGSGDDESQEKTFLPEPEDMEVPEEGSSQEGVLVMDETGAEVHGEEASQEDPQDFIDTCLPGVEVEVSNYWSVLLELCLIIPIYKWENCETVIDIEKHEKCNVNNIKNETRNHWFLKEKTLIHFFKAFWTYTIASTYFSRVVMTMANNPWNAILLQWWRRRWRRTRTRTWTTWISSATKTTTKEIIIPRYSLWELF